MQLLCKIKPLSGGLQKKWRLPYSLLFRALRRGVLCFFCRCVFHGENCETKLPFFGLFQKSQNRQFCFAIFSMKNKSTEKTEYTTMKSKEKKEDGHLRFFIFETLSQRFLQNIFRNFQFFEKIKKWSTPLSDSRKLSVVEWLIARCYLQVGDRSNR